VVPIEAAYQGSCTGADALQLAREAWQALLDRIGSLWPLAGVPEIPDELAAAGEGQTAAGSATVDSRPLSPEVRGLIALLNMDEQHNAFVGQWEITDDGEASRVPSRVVILGGTELLIPGLTNLERRIVQGQELDWETYGLAAVDLALIASGGTLLRFAKTAGRVGHDAARISRLRSGALATAQVLGIKAVRYGLPIGLVVLMVRHPHVFTRLLWDLAEGLGMPGIIGVIVGWGIVIVPLAFLLSWMLFSVRMLRLAGWLLAGAARGCQRLTLGLAVPDRHRL
jgi:hypothetical protein